MIPKSLKNIESLLRALSETCPAKLAGLIVLMSFAGFFRTDISAQNSLQTSSDNTTISIENEADQFSKVWNEDSYRRAESLYLQAAGQWQSLGDHQRYAACLRKAAQLNVRLNEFETAWKLLSDSRKAEQKTGNFPGESETLSDLTLIALWKKDKKTAADLQNKSLTLAEKSKNPATLAKAYFAASQYIYRHKNDLPLMIEMLESSLKYFRAANDPTGEIQTLSELAYTEVMNNDRLQGKNYAAEAVRLSRAAGKQRELALALIALGDADQRMGNWQSAFQSFKEAEAIYPENLDFYEKAILFVRFGFYFETFGDPAQARSYFEKARPLFIKTGNPFGDSELTTRIGQISHLLGENANALKSFEEGLKIGIQSNDLFSIAYALENMGDLFFSEAEHKKALDYYKNALENYNKVGIKHAVATIKEKTGRLYFKTGNKILAEKYFLEALQTNSEIKSKTGEKSNLYQLALLYRAENQLQKSLENISRCLMLTDQMSGETANRKLKQSYLSETFTRYQLYIDLLMKLNKQNPDINFALAALQAAERSRARSMLENLSLSEAEFTKDADGETLRREKEIRVLLNSKADKLTDLLSNNAGKSETDQISFEINELENELEEIKAELKQNSPLYSAIKNPAPFDVGEFQKNVLDDDSLLLEFSFGEEESYLWLIGKTEFSSYVLPPREQIETKIEILRQLLASREMLKDESIEEYQNRIANADAEYSKIARDLSRDLFGQIAGKFGSKRLIIVPDGKLGYFPVSALPLPESENNEPILLSNEIVYEPSASTLALLTNNKQTNSASKSLLIFSDPVFSADDSRLLAENKNDLSVQTETDEKFRFVESLNSLVRLDSSKREADSIIDILGTSNADDFSGFSANRERLLNANARDYKILHFATHGLIDEKRPELSGIVLSRFDENGQKTDEFFRLHDIYGMNLNSDLVVLSACNTGIGKEVRGEGLMSLNNAFLSVGAKSVMASLWKVEDGATLELMKNFYDAMANEKLTPSKALQKAQIKMQQSERYKSPFYWAAFTVQGDYRNVPDISGGFDGRIYLLPAAVILLLAAFFGYRIIRRRNCK